MKKILKKLFAKLKRKQKHEWIYGKRVDFGYGEIDLYRTHEIKCKKCGLDLSSVQLAFGNDWEPFSGLALSPNIKAACKNADNIITCEEVIIKNIIE